MTQKPSITFDHMMIRVKDPKASLAFYQDALGMTLIKHKDYEKGQFSLYFLAFLDHPEQANDPDFTPSFKLELTHNWGTENDPNFTYHNGNSEPRGYGHICVTVPDLAESVAWFDSQQVTFVKRPEEGTMRNIAFIADPDGYRIELIEAKQLG